MIDEKINKVEGNKELGELQELEELFTYNLSFLEDYEESFLNKELLIKKIDKFLNKEREGYLTFLKNSPVLLEDVLEEGIIKFTMHTKYYLFKSNTYDKKRMIQGIKNAVRSEKKFANDWLPYLLKLTQNQNESTRLYAIIALQVFPSDAEIARILMVLTENESSHRVKEQITFLINRWSPSCLIVSPKIVNPNTVRIAFGFRESRDEEYDRPVYMTPRMEESDNNIEPVDRPKRYGSYFSEKYPHLLGKFLLGFRRKM
jgi:hypothetical protein